MKDAHVNSSKRHRDACLRVALPDDRARHDLGHANDPDRTRERFVDPWSKRRCVRTGAAPFSGAAHGSGHAAGRPSGALGCECPPPAVAGVSCPESLGTPGGGTVVRAPKSLSHSMFLLRLNVKDVKGPGLYVDSGRDCTVRGDGKLARKHHFRIKAPTPPQSSPIHDCRLPTLASAGRVQPCRHTPFIARSSPFHDCRCPSRWPILTGT